MVSRAELAAGEKIAHQIQAKIDRALEPLRREMRIMGWRPEYRVIVWEAVARKAMEWVIEAEREKSNAPDLSHP